MEGIRPSRPRAAILIVGAVTAGLIVAPGAIHGQVDQADPRVGLGAGWMDAEEAASGMVLVGHQDRPPGFFLPDDPGYQPLKNSDLAFRGGYAFQGNYNGFNIYDISDPTSPPMPPPFAICDTAWKRTLRRAT